MRRRSRSSWACWQASRTFLLVHDCEVFLVEPLEKGEVRWEKVLAPEPYPLFTSCQRQSIRYEAGVLRVTLGRMAFGAGVACHGW
jgi:hypothetical protein